MLRRALAPVLVGIAMLGLWHLLVTLNDVPSYLVPPPLQVAETLFQDRALLFAALLVTLKIALLALALALVTGVLIAFVFVQSRLMEMSLLPYAILLQVTPIVSIAPLIIIWARNLTLALVLCATMAALFPIISNTSLGLRSVDPGLLDLFRLHRASRWQTLVRLRIPSALPYFFAGLKVSSGLALIGTVVAEFVAGTGGSQSGLAYQILMAGINLNMPRLFAALFVITLAGVALYAMTSWLAKVALRRWHESEVAPA